jgi:hypothetical protein
MPHKFAITPTPTQQQQSFVTQVLKNLGLPMVVGLLKKNVPVTLRKLEFSVIHGLNNKVYLPLLQQRNVV